MSGAANTFNTEELEGEKEKKFLESAEIGRWVVGCQGRRNCRRRLTVSVSLPARRDGASFSFSRAGRGPTESVHLSCCAWGRELVFCVHLPPCFSSPALQVVPKKKESCQRSLIKKENPPNSPPPSHTFCLSLSPALSLPQQQRQQHRRR